MQAIKSASMLYNLQEMRVIEIALNCWHSLLSWEPKFVLPKMYKS